MHILATFATLCCQTRWPRNHSCTTQEHVSFFRTFSGTRQKPTGHFRTFSHFRQISSFFEKPSKSEKTMRTSEKMKFTCSTNVQNRIHNAQLCKKHFLHVHNFLQMCKCANVQMCKCAKNRRAQNAQICSANYFSNAEMHKSANAQICTVQISTSASFCFVKIFCVCVIYFLI